MEDLEFPQDDILAQIDWNDFLDAFPEPSPTNALQMEPPIVAESFLFNSSPDSISSWIYEIENALMDDHEGNGFSLPSDDFSLFLADILVDSHAGSSGVDSVIHDEDKVSPVLDDNLMAEVLVEPHGRPSLVDVVGDVDSNASYSGDHSNNPQKEDKADAENIDDSVVEHADDPISKKQKRQLRNRDAAVKSRQRKKEYVRDLEMKSRFLEGECLRLGRLLQCYFAENQALRFSLQMGGASGATLAEQESAVLLLESLLLGSLLWLVGIVCLFTLPQSTLEAVPRVAMVEESPGSVPLNGGENNDPRYLYSSIQTRRCKATKTRMKRSILEATLEPSLCF